MKIGILGGTFDPIHNAHIEMALNAKEQFKLDKVWILPSATPPHKDKNKISDIRDRVNMINLAISDYKGIELCDYEVNKDDVTYTADTIVELKKLYPNDKFYFIIGSDSIDSFSSWYKPEVILENANLLVARRDDESAERMEEKIEELEEKYCVMIPSIFMEEMPESSTLIRKGEQSIEKCCPKEVALYVKVHKLYDDDVNEAWSASQIFNDIRDNLSQDRFKHSVGVANTAVEMAKTFNVNPNKAYLAGILHDCAKNLDDIELFTICAENDVNVTQIEQKKPFLLHAKAGVIVAKEKYNITDQEVLDAIRWHTTGRANMNDLEKIIFTADYIEPNREGLPRLEELRMLSKTDLDKLVKEILENMMDHLKEKDDLIDEHTVEAYEFYK